MISQTNGRKRKRYNTFRASHNPVPPKRSLRRHLKVISSVIPPRNDISAGLPTEICVDQREYVDMCLSSEQNDNLHEMHEDDESASSVEDENNINIVNIDKADEIGEICSSLQESDEMESFDEIVCSYISSDFETHSETHEVHPDDSLFFMNESESAGKEQDPPVYPTCPLRLSESVLLIMTLAIRHKLTGDALADVIKLIDLHCIPGPNSHSIKTLRELKSYFADFKESLDLCYYCNYCYCLLPSEHTPVCPICDTDLGSSAAKSYFVVLPIEHQLSKFLSRELIYFYLLFSLP